MDDGPFISAIYWNYRFFEEFRSSSVITKSLCNKHVIYTEYFILISINCVYCIYNF